MERFSLTGLPDKYKNNWHIYLDLRRIARIRYAKAKADAADDSVWDIVFNRASDKWCLANPIDDMWHRKWPEGAHEYLGRLALIEARLMLEKQEV